MGHNKVRDFLAKKVAPLFKDTAVEPALNPLNGESLAAGANTSNEARSDIRIKGYLQEYHNTFFDVKVIHLQSSAHVLQKPIEALKKCEQQKEAKYKERINKIENGSFIPVVFSSSGGRAPQANMLLSKLITKIATKRKEPRQEVAARIATQLSFLFLKHSILCLKGQRPRPVEHTE